MPNIFDFLNGILFSKKEMPVNSMEDEKGFDIYMVNRWVSMTSPDNAKIINETTNRFSTVFDSKQSQYKFLQCIIPKQKFKKINYIKRKSVD